MVRLSTLVIKIYQKISKAFLSINAGHFFVHATCNFYPSCSEYSAESLKKYGFIKGSIKSVSRILRCHPWAHPGVDMP